MTRDELEAALMLFAQRIELSVMALMDRNEDAHHHFRELVKASAEEIAAAMMPEKK